MFWFYSGTGNDVIGPLRASLVLWLSPGVPVLPADSRHGAALVHGNHSIAGITLISDDYEGLFIVYIRHATRWCLKMIVRGSSDPQKDPGHLNW
ncbi:hypothetical protein [Alcanivorax sp.]|uniref:hypothetical protein n=1 Tax=Alcanivorax sp. TaxID=1872427 RepID=UPI0025C69868|nr:hypothetical protein [Alcanivorax sp.]